MFSAVVLTFEWLSIWPSAFKTTITVIFLWTSMPTYLTLLIGRLLDVRDLGHCLFKITTSGASFHITCMIVPENHALLPKAYAHRASFRSATLSTGCCNLNPLPLFRTACRHHARIGCRIYRNFLGSLAASICSMSERDVLPPGCS